MAKASLKLVTSRDASRDALAAAIADAETAQRNLGGARSAASKAEEQVWSASARLTALRDSAAQARPSDAIIASLTAGNTDIATIDRPAAETRAKIENAEQELSAWRRALAAAQAAIPVRENALDWAQRHVRDAVSEVVRSGVDIDAMLEAAERTRDVLLAQRAALMQIQATLPHFSPEQTKVAAFLADPFLLYESTSWSDHPAVAPWREAFDALHVDAAAALPAIATAEATTVVILPSNGRE